MGTQASPVFGEAFVGVKRFSVRAGIQALCRERHTGSLRESIFPMGRAISYLSSKGSLCLLSVLRVAVSAFGKGPG